MAGADRVSFTRLHPQLCADVGVLSGSLRAADVDLTAAGSVKVAATPQRPRSASFGHAQVPPGRARELAHERTRDFFFFIIN